jgi:DNA-binding protein YbaB
VGRTIREAITAPPAITPRNLIEDYIHRATQEAVRRVKAEQAAQTK